MASRRRVLVFGLDSAVPDLVFGRLARRMPALQGLIARGAHGAMRTVTPPITVPAWMSIFTGRDPGELGIYGFRNRASYQYEDLTFASSAQVRYPTVWDTAGEAGMRSIVVGVPLTYPVKPVNGVVIGDFMAPARDERFVYPPHYLPRLDGLAGGEYLADVEEFRSDDHARLVDEISAMTRGRFRLFRALLRREEWDLAVVHEIGLDRIQHAFWQFMDEGHRRHQPDGPYERVIEHYHALLDEEIAATLAQAGDDVTVFVLSDHGARRLLGGVCVNEFLIRSGLLHLKSYPTSPTRLTPDMVDWEHTAAWGEGGYYARIFMNVAGREPHGVVPADDYESSRTVLAELLRAIPGPSGEPIGNVVMRPEQEYRARADIPPDLMVFFGDLDYRSVGTVGWNALHVEENDTGPDGANHDWNALFIAAGPGVPSAGRLDGLTAFDVAPTLLDQLGLPAPEGLRGRPLCSLSMAPPAVAGRRSA